MKDRFNKMDTTATTQQESTVPSSSNNVNDSNKNFLNPYNFMTPPIGGIVRCTTCLGNQVQGKVVAYDLQTKMLALRTTNPNKSGLFDISIVNVDWCSNLEVVEEPSDAPEMLPNLNIQKLRRRTRDNIENKYKEINSLGDNVSSLAQHLYFTILKTLSDVEWNDKKIVVMNSVIIEPPYDVNSCFSKNGDNSQAVEHVKKIVKKFHDDYFKVQAQQQQTQHGFQIDTDTTGQSSLSSSPLSPKAPLLKEDTSNTKKQNTRTSASPPYNQQTSSLKNSLLNTDK